MDFEPWRRELIQRCLNGITCNPYVLENTAFCSLFTNRLRPFRDFIHHTVASIIHPSSSHRRHDAALTVSRCWCFVLVMSFASFSDSLKYFHTADTFAALVCATIGSCHVIVRYNLFGLLAYSASIPVAETFGASLVLAWVFEARSQFFLRLMVQL